MTIRAIAAFVLWLVVYGGSWPPRVPIKTLVTVACVTLLGIAMAFVGVTMAHARDLGQWENNDPARAAWFKQQKIPGFNPGTMSIESCCGEADAYYADSYEMAEGGAYIAIITDERDDEPLRRPHIPIGTKFRVPRDRVQDVTKTGNPTGHGLIFVSVTRTGENVISADGSTVWCYYPPGGG